MLRLGWSLFSFPGYRHQYICSCPSPPPVEQLRDHNSSPRLVVQAHGRPRKHSKKYGYTEFSFRYSRISFTTPLWTNWPCLMKPVRRFYIWLTYRICIVFENYTIIRSVFQHLGGSVRVEKLSTGKEKRLCRVIILDIAGFPFVAPFEDVTQTYFLKYP